jgi:hypothetical protein
MGKKPNFWNDFVRPLGHFIVQPGEKMASRAAKTLKPVSKPTLGALTDKAVEAVKAIPAQQAVEAGAVASMKKGGMIKTAKGKKTKLIRAHEGELVVPKHLVKHVPKTVKDKIKKGGGKDM